MSEDKKHPRHDLDLDAQAQIALSEARAMPPGSERTKALKKAGLLRNAADARKISYARRGRPPKS
jgi:ABC-type molybdate transport system substrate-binding protein